MSEDNERTLPGGAILNDRRTPEQIEATIGFIVATDRFMSGWGRAPGRSYFAVPFTNNEQADIIEENMRNRSEMKRVRCVIGKHYRPHARTGDHISICEIERGGFYTRGWFKRGDA